MQRPVYINYVYVTTYLLVYQSVSRGGRKERGPGLPPCTCYVTLSYVMSCLVTNVLSLHGREKGEGLIPEHRRSEVPIPGGSVSLAAGRRTKVCWVSVVSL